MQGSRAASWDAVCAVTEVSTILIITQVSSRLEAIVQKKGSDNSLDLIILSKSHYST